MSMDVLVLRFDAPLMSFGGVLVDQRNPTDRFPGVSMITGLLANALGWEHHEFPRLQRLQNRIAFAARWDVEPEQVMDYQTVDLGQALMTDTGWTTRGVREDRGGGTAGSGTHIRRRHYLANGVLTLVLALEGDEEPTPDDLARALRAPARPIFLGRKACLPAGPIYVDRRVGTSLRALLEAVPLARSSSDGGEVTACWPAHEDETESVVETFDRRDWANQMHTGKRRMIHGTVRVSP